MADIDVVKKDSRAWIWIVLALVLAVILWFALAGRDDVTTTGMVADPALWAMSIPSL